jgi:hypothetical protein
MDAKNEDAEQDGNTSEESTSLSGKGWDILVGGQTNPFAKGGEDPFDQKGAVTPESTENPFVAESASGTVNASAADPGLAGMAQPEPGEASPASGVPVMSGIVEMPPSEPLTSGGVIEVAPQAETASPDIIEVSPPSPTPSMPGVVEVEPLSGVTPPPGSPHIIEMPPSIPVDLGIESGMQGAVAGLGGPPASAWAASSQSFSVSDPFQASSFDENAPEQDLAVDENVASKLVTMDRMNALWEEINETYDLVINDVRGYYDTTGKAIVQLKESRELLMAGADNFDNAEKLVMEVKAHLRLEEKIRQWTKTRGVWLEAYLLIWLLMLALSSLLTLRVDKVAVNFVPDWMAQTWLPGMMGGVGAVVGSLWVLNKHISKNRDFDPIHTLWYVTNPFLGIALGVITYIIIRGGGGILINAAGGSGFVFTPETSLMLYALCVVVGFNQNVLWTLIDRFVKTVIPKDSDGADLPAATASDVTPPVVDSSKG